MLCFPFLFFFLHTRGWKSKHVHEALQSSTGDCLDLDFMKKKQTNKPRTFKYTESVFTVAVILLFLSVQNQKMIKKEMIPIVFFF